MDGKLYPNASVFPDLQNIYQKLTGNLQIVGLKLIIDKIFEHKEVIVKCCRYSLVNFLVKT